MRRAAGGLREGGAWRHGDTSSSGFDESYPHILCFCALRRWRLRLRKSARRMAGACRARKDPGTQLLEGWNIVPAPGAATAPFWCKVAGN
ncbi:hypothetical protein ISE1_2158 [plant metagenome]|uniref:Uncharacterized protein n=1 Tax=plant metagenome TaxID=1297885 RepID=A0A484TGW8_9ZZZZ